jgi:hypothetical protein
MTTPRLHLDEDTSSTVLQSALQKMGHNVTRTPVEWMPFGADDEFQLVQATAHGRIIFTYNIGDFTRLALQYPQHAGIVFGKQNWTVSSTISALHRMLSETEAEEWIGQVRWLSQWRSH